MARRIAITTTSFGEQDKSIIPMLKREGFDVVVNPYARKMKEREIIDLCFDVDGVIAGTETYSPEVLEKLHSLKVISRCGAGMDNIDIDVAKKRGIEVYNTPDAPTAAVAELTVGLIITLLRKVREMDSGLRIGKWKKTFGNQVYGKNVGIIGFGRIGNKVAGLMKGFGCNVAYYDTRDISGQGGFVAMSSKEDLLRWADIVSLHVSSSGMVIGRKEFALMKNGSWLVNMSRGGAVDEDALYDNLKAGTLLGAALDVFESEPYEGPLKSLDNIILTPHIGSYAVEARSAMEMAAALNVLKGLKNAQ